MNDAAAAQSSTGPEAGCADGSCADAGLRACEGDGEPNETPEDACLLELGVTFEAQFTTLEADNVDCYAVILNADTAYTLMVDKVSGPETVPIEDDLAYRLVTAAGVELINTTRSNNGANYEEVSVDVGELATLCLEARSRNSQYDYRIRLDTDIAHGLKQDPVTFEPNNTVSQACPVDVGQQVDSIFTKEISEYRDCYALDLKAGVQYTLMFEKVSGPANVPVEDDLAYRLTTTSGVDFVDTTQSNNGATYIEVSTPVDEDATLCIEARALSSQYEYSFRVDTDVAHGLEQDPVSFEPNNSPSQAYPIELGVIIESLFTTELREYRDCYSVEIEANVEYTMLFARTAGPSPTFAAEDDLVYLLKIGGPEELVSGSRSDDGVNTHVFSSTSAGPAVLCVESRDLSRQYRYEVSIERSREPCAECASDG